MVARDRDGLHPLAIRWDRRGAAASAPWHDFGDPAEHRERPPTALTGVRETGVARERRNSRHLQRIIAKAEVLYDSGDVQFAWMRQLAKRRERGLESCQVAMGTIARRGKRQGIEITGGGAPSV